MRNDCAGSKAEWVSNCQGGSEVEGLPQVNAQKDIPNDFRFPQNFGT